MTTITTNTTDLKAIANKIVEDFLASYGKAICDDDEDFCGYQEEICNNQAHLWPSMKDFERDIRHAMFDVFKAKVGGCDPADDTADAACGIIYVDHDVRNEFYFLSIHELLKAIGATRSIRVIDENAYVTRYEFPDGSALLHLIQHNQGIDSSQYMCVEIEEWTFDDGDYVEGVEVDQPPRW